MTDIETKTSKLTKKEEKSGETNGKSWTRYVLTFEDFIGSTFDAELVKDIKTNEIFKVDFKKVGQYNNIVDLEKVEKTEFQTADKVPESVWLEKDRRIVRQNCNQRAIELAELMNKIDPNVLKELIKVNEGIQNVIISFAKFFEEIVWA